MKDVLGKTGRDPEKEVYRLLVLLRCKPFLEPYVADLRRPVKMGPDTAFPLGLKGFHTLYLGMDFRYAQRDRVTGVHASSLAAKHQPATGFCFAVLTHTILPSLQLLSKIVFCSRAYRWGMLGPFQEYTELTRADKLQRTKNVWGKAFLGRVIWPYKKLRSKKYSYPGF